MKNILRRWSNPLYRRAHKHELPTRLELLASLLVSIALVAAIYIASSYATVQQAEESNETAARVLACLNGRAALGSFEDHGQKWEVLCNTYYKEIK